MVPIGETQNGLEGEHDGDGRREDDDAFAEVVNQATEDRSAEDHYEVDPVREQLRVGGSISQVREHHHQCEDADVVAAANGAQDPVKDGEVLQVFPAELVRFLARRDDDLLRLCSPVQHAESDASKHGKQCYCCAAPEEDVRVAITIIVKTLPRSREWTDERAKLVHRERRGERRREIGTAEVCTEHNESISVFISFSLYFWLSVFIGCVEKMNIGRKKERKRRSE